MYSAVGVTVSEREQYSKEQTIVRCIIIHIIQIFSQHQNHYCTVHTVINVVCLVEVTPLKEIRHSEIWGF
jgi:hypothetical protein